ncbi:MAG: metallopeptidase TldD-related protein [Candidatus Competibacteraceae bacterium]|nr:metallopeptidase TldD-related protein [Candidatus Competibacteraceae bacterium]
MQDYFYAMAFELERLLKGDELYTCVFAGEESDFVRLNHARVRQAGSVCQRSLTVDLIRGRRHSSVELTLSGDGQSDRRRLAGAVTELRRLLEYVPEDPWLLYATEPRSSEQIHRHDLPPGEALLEAVLEAGRGRDLVGILARGTVYRGFASSLGQRNWYARPSFNLDWSLYLHGDKAVKSRYAGVLWNGETLKARMEAATRRLEALARPVRTLARGRYRAYLAPMALEEILGLLTWEGFGLRAHRTRTSPLSRMSETGQRLDARVSLSENTREGVAPNFQEAGFIRPPRVELIRAGRWGEVLVCPRSAVEFGVPCNGAGEDESPLSLDLAPGELAEEQVLTALDTGLYLGNLWYLNWSDANGARFTGMTRFACFWVEQGRIEAPIEVMRFDDSLYQLLGERLEGLTRERELLLDPESYGSRSTRSARLPGALVGGMDFTL